MYFRLDLENPVQDRRGDNVPRCTVGDDAAIAQRNDAIGIARRQIEIVQHHDDGAAMRAVEFAQQFENVELMRDVEIGRRLVEKHDVRRCATVMAIQTRCRCPPESASTGVSRHGATPVIAMACSTAARSSSVVRPKSP